MVFNAIFNNISAISWWLVLLVQETGVPEKTTDLSQVPDKLNYQEYGIKLLIRYISCNFWSRFWSYARH